MATLSALAFGAHAQGAQTEIEWLEEVSEPSKDVASPSAQASTVSEGRPLKLRLGASMWSRYELRRQYEGLEPIAPDDRIRDFDAMAYRARMAFRTEPLSLAKGLAIELALVPQASGFWAPSGDNTDAAIALHEGYVRPRFGEHAWLQVGRFEMSYGDEWLIGANGWHETGRSFDGVRVHLGAQTSAAFGDVFFSLLREGRTAAEATTSDDRIGSGDQMLLGVYGDLGPLIAENFHLDPYGLLLMAPRSNRIYAAGALAPVRREAAYEGTFGLRVKGEYGVVDYRVEGGIQFGQRTQDTRVVDALAGAADGEIGFHLPASIRIAVGGTFASGDDPTTNKDEGWADRFSQPHRWLGLSDMFRTRTNVTGVSGQLSAAPVEGLDVGVQGHFLFKHRAIDPESTATPPDVSARYAGSEVDPYVGYEIAKGLAIRSEYAIFIPSTETYGNEKAAHYFGLQFGYENPG
jgi:hypothetical protein